MYTHINERKQRRAAPLSAGQCHNRKYKIDERLPADVIVVCISDDRVIMIWHAMVTISMGKLV